MKTLYTCFHRFAWTAHPTLQRAVDNKFVQTLHKRLNQINEMPETEGAEGAVKKQRRKMRLEEKLARGFPHDDDAFHTLIQWLFSRQPHTRG